MDNLPLDTPRFIWPVNVFVFRAYLGRELYLHLPDIYYICCLLDPYYYSPTAIYLKLTLWHILPIDIPKFILPVNVYLIRTYFVREFSMKGIFDFVLFAIIAVVFYFLGFYNLLGPVMQSLRNIIS